MKLEKKIVNVHSNVYTGGILYVVIGVHYCAELYCPKSGVAVLFKVVVWPFREKTQVNKFILCFAWIAELNAKRQANVRMTHHHSRSNHISVTLYTSYKSESNVIHYHHMMSCLLLD